MLTSFAQLLSQELGLPVERFHLVQGDTARVPSGGGHGGARSLHMGGGALVLAARALVETAKPTAAQLLQSRADAVSFERGRFHAPDAGEVDLFSVARHVAETTGQPLASHGARRNAPLTFPNGAQVAEVEIDPETGEATLLRYVAVDDYGTLINPLLTEAQVHGGLAQGIGQALMEEARYDPDGGQLLSATFMDYAMPRARDLPSIETEFRPVPSPKNPLGVKGSGECGVTGSIPANTNAILDALARAGATTDMDMPFTPEKVWRALHRATTEKASRSGSNNT